MLHGYPGEYHVSTEAKLPERHATVAVQGLAANVYESAVTQT